MELTQEQEFEFRYRYEQEQKAKQTAPVTKTEPSHVFNPNPIPGEDFLMLNPKGVSKTISPGTEFKASLAPPDYRFSRYQKELVNKYGPSGADRLRLNGDSIEVLDDDDTWRQVGLTGGQFLADAIPNVIEGVGGVVGAIGGTAVGAMGGAAAPVTAPLGGIAGGASGSGISRYGAERLRGAAARAVDGENAPTKEQTEEAARNAAQQAALWSGVGDAGFGMLRAAKGWLRGFGPAVTPRQARLLTDYNKEYKAAADAVSAPLRLDQILTDQPTNPDFQDFKSLVSGALTNPKVQNAEHWRQGEVFDSVEKYLNPVDQRVPGITNPDGTAAPGFREQAGMGFDVALNSEFKDKVGVHEKAVGAAQRQADKAGAAFPQVGDESQIAGNIGNEVRQMRTTAKQQSDSLYGAYRTTIGQEEGSFVSKYEVPIDRGILAEKEILDGLADAAIIERQLSGRSLLTSQLSPTKKSSIVGPDGKAIESPASVDLAMLDDAITRLGTYVREARAGKEALPVQMVDAQRVLGKLKDWRDVAIEKLPEEVGKARTAADNFYKEYAQTYKTGLLKQMLTKDASGAYRLSDPSAVIKMMEANDSVAVEQLVNLSKSSPALQGELRKAALAHYRAKVMDGDTIVASKHDAYMKGVFGGGYFQTLKPLFPKEDQALIQHAGGLAKAVLRAEEKREAAKLAWANTAAGKIKSMEEYAPEALVDIVFGRGRKPLEPQQIDVAMKVLKKHAPESVSEYQAGIRQHIVGAVKDPQTGELSLQKLDSLLERHGNRINAVLGPEYVHRLQNVVTILRREGGRIAPNLNSQMDPVKDARKAFFGPISHGGLLASVAGGQRKDTMQRKLYEALTDPDALREVEKYYSKLGLQMATATQFSLLAEDQINE